EIGPLDKSCISDPEIRNLKLEVRFKIVQFRDLRCRIRPISKCSPSFLSSLTRPCRLRYQNPSPCLSLPDRVPDPSRKPPLPCALRAASWAGRSSLRGSGAHDRSDLPAHPDGPAPVSPSTALSRSSVLRS